MRTSLVTAFLCLFAGSSAHAGKALHSAREQASGRGAINPKLMDAKVHSTGKRGEKIVRKFSLRPSSKGRLAQPTEVTYKNGTRRLTDATLVSTEKRTNFSNGTAIVTEISQGRGSDGRFTAGKRYDFVISTKATPGSFKMKGEHATHLDLTQ